MEEMNTAMTALEVSSWLSDLEMDEYNDLFPQECTMDSFDPNDEDGFSHDIVNALLLPTLEQQPLTSGSTSTTLRNSFTDETSLDFEKPTMLLKTTHENGTVTENFSPSLRSQILSFDTTSFYGLESTLNPKQSEVVSVSRPKLENTHLSTQNPKGSLKNEKLETKTLNGVSSKRSPAHAQDHIMAERKRREKISQSFIALAALLPDLKKMDKATVLADTIKYVKEIKERLEVLKEENKKTRDEDSSSCDDESIEGSSESLFKVEARVLGQDMLIRIHCKKHKDLLAKIISEIQCMDLFIVSSSFLPFGDCTVDITIVAQIGEGYQLSIKEFVKNLKMGALKFMP